MAGWWSSKPTLPRQFPTLSWKSNMWSRSGRSQPMRLRTTSWLKLKLYVRSLTLARLGLTSMSSMGVSRSSLKMKRKKVKTKSPSWPNMRPTLKAFFFILSCNLYFVFYILCFFMGFMLRAFLDFWVDLVMKSWLCPLLASLFRFLLATLFRFLLFEILFYIFLKKYFYKNLRKKCS